MKFFNFIEQFYAEKKQPIQPEMNNANSEVNVRRIDWKKNILTRIMALLCLGAWICVFLSTRAIDVNAEFAVLAVLFFQLYVGLPATMIGFVQIIISAIRWKRLTIFDKIISVPIILGLVYFMSTSGYRFLTDAFYKYQDPKKATQALEQNNPNLCGQIRLEGNWKMKEDCYDGLASKNQDPSMCGSIECFEEFAFTLKDPFLCTSIKKRVNHRWQDADKCYIKTLDTFWENIVDKEAVCKLIESDFDREKCLGKKEKTKVKIVDSPAPKDLSVSFLGPFLTIILDASEFNSFNVYRSVNPNGPWELIGADFPSFTYSLTDNHGFVDYNFPRNVRVLYYRVALSYGEGYEGSYSSVSSVNIPQQELEK